MAVGRMISLLKITQAASRLTARNEAGCVFSGFVIAFVHSLCIPVGLNATSYTPEVVVRPAPGDYNSELFGICRGVCRRSPGSFHNQGSEHPIDSEKCMEPDVLQTRLVGSTRKSREATDRIRASLENLCVDATLETSHICAYQGIAVRIAIAARDNHNQVNESPDAAATDGKDLQNSEDSMSCIETVYTKPTQEDAEQECG